MWHINCWTCGITRVAFIILAALAVSKQCYGIATFAALWALMPPDVKKTIT